MRHRGLILGLLLTQALGIGGLAAFWGFGPQQSASERTIQTKRALSPEAALLQATAGPSPSLEDVRGALDRAAQTLAQNPSDPSEPRPAPDQARLEAEVELGLRQGRYTYTWAALGGAVVAADDAQARQRMADEGFLLRTAPLGATPATFGLHGARARAVLGGLAALIDRPAIEARWDFTAKRLIPHRVGLALDIDAGLRALHQGLIEGHAAVTLPVRETFPEARIDTEPLGSWSPSERIATFRTPYEARKHDRSHNLRLAARALNGVILMPGQAISYNAIVGERSLERGYREAPVIVHGEMLEGIGGGACQISSTLYAAALFAGLDIVERASHSLPSSYIDKGLDAVVSWPQLDLKIRNNYPFPLAIRTLVDDTHVIVSLYGSQPGRRVIIRREVTEKIPFIERVEVSAEYKPKQVRKIREGHYGYRISKGRILWEGSTEHFERLPEDTYRPRPRHVRIGPDTLYPDPDADSTAAPTPPDDDDALSVED